MQIEINKKSISDISLTDVNSVIMITPPINQDYWAMRVKLFKDQSIIGFFKFGMIGIGFSQEEDWNTNLPSRTPAKEIFEHIKRNKKYDEISDGDCIKAIELIQKHVPIKE